MKKDYDSFFKKIKNYRRPLGTCCYKWRASVIPSKKDLIMDTDEKRTQAQTVRGKGVSQETDEIEDVIELEDVVEEPFGEKDPDQAGLQSESDEAASLAAGALEEEDIIELVDEAVDEPGSQDDDVIELNEVVEEEDLQLDEGASSEWSSPGPGGGESHEDSVLEDVDMEMPGAEPIGATLGEKPAEDTARAQDLQGFDPDSVLESTIIEKVSDEQIEAIISRVAERIMEKKADRVLLEVAEAAIAKEIEKIKQAL